jgi:hypothetical protein
MVTLKEITEQDDARPTLLWGRKKKEAEQKQHNVTIIQRSTTSSTTVNPNDHTCIFVRNKKQTTTNQVEPLTEIGSIQNGMTY